MSNQQEKAVVGLSMQGVSLHVADVEKSVAFYSKLPGAKIVIHRPGYFAKFKFGEGYIQVVSIPAEEKSFHIELDTENQQSLYEQLTASGFEPEGPPTLQPFGRTNFSLLDPDGNVLEFDTP